MARTKDRVRAYARAHPSASLRDVQKALGISSPSVVKFHLDNDTAADRLAEMERVLRDLAVECAKEFGMGGADPDCSSVYAGVPDGQGITWGHLRRAFAVLDKYEQRNGK